MQPTLAVETFPDLTQQESVVCDSVTQTDRFGEIRTGSATISRSAWDAIDTALNRRDDVLRVDAPDGETLIRGRFDRLARENRSRVITVASGELDLQQAEPIDSVTYLSNASKPGAVAFQLLQGAGVPEPATVTNGLIAFGHGGFFSENDFSAVTVGNASFAEVLREQAAILGHEVRVRNTVDSSEGKFIYDFLSNAEVLRDLGTYDDSDVRGSIRGVTLSPSNGNIIGEPSVTQDTRVDATHIKAFGAGEGPKQITATVAADDFSTGRKVFEQVISKEVSEQDRLQALAESRLREIRRIPQLQEVELTVVDEDLVLGDFVQVDLPDANISEELRVVELIDRIDAEGRRQEVTLSTRRQSRPRERQRQPVRSVRQFETGTQGFLTDRQLTSGFDDIPGGHPQRLVVFDFPEKIIDQKRVDLLVEGRANPDGFVPSDVAVEVGGVTVATISGGGEFRKRIDVTADIGPGETTITATPDTEGSLALTLSVELRRRGDTVDV
jgi:hypothetical protein